jgi:hypothetical protein
MTAFCIDFYGSYLSTISQVSMSTVHHRECPTLREVASKDEPKIIRSALHGFVCVSLMAAGGQLVMDSVCNYVYCENEASSSVYTVHRKSVCQHRVS